MDVCVSVARKKYLSDCGSTNVSKYAYPKQSKDKKTKEESESRNFTEDKQK